LPAGDVLAGAGHGVRAERVVYRCRLGSFVYGVVAQAGVIVTAAPVAGWAIGQPVEKVQAWLESKGGSCRRLWEPFADQSRGYV
jgi:hypothetical protein